MLILFVRLFSSCNSSENKTSLSTSSRLLPESDVMERLRYQKNNIDSLFKHNTDKVIVVAKLTDGNEPILIKNGNFPENVETTYNILKDSLGNVMLVSEFPFSESGDWSITFSHYFDKKGKTFAFERQTNFFNSICTNGIAFETRTEFYDSDFKLIDKTYKLVDEKNTTLEKDSCQFPYDYNYDISKNSNKYLKVNNLKHY